MFDIVVTRLESMGATTGGAKLEHIGAVIDWDRDGSLRQLETLLLGVRFQHRAVVVINHRG
jgi:hypothetical protein